MFSRGFFNVMVAARGKKAIALWLAPPPKLVEGGVLPTTAGTPHGPSISRTALDCLPSDVSDRADFAIHAPPPMRFDIWALRQIAWFILMHCAEIVFALCFRTKIGVHHPYDYKLPKHGLMNSNAESWRPTASRFKWTYDRSMRLLDFNATFNYDTTSTQGSY